MCGRFNAIDSPEVQVLLENFDIELYPEFRFTPDASPGSRISIFRQVGDKRMVSDATWWLTLDPSTLKLK